MDINLSDAERSFQDAIQAHDLEPPEVFKPGTFQRFPGIDKGTSNRAGWCKLFPDGKGGVFGDYSSGLSETWFVNSKSASPEQSAQAQRERKQARIKGEEETSARHTQAAREAQEKWNQGQPAPEGHPYLRRKRIKPYILRATVNGTLLVPVYDRDGNMSSVQTIFERNGEFQKRYHKGGATGGDHHLLIGASTHYLSEDAGYTGTICIAEGLATAASIHEATGHLAVVAFQANSLEAVAELVRERRPNAKIVLCADNDATTKEKGKGNPGVEAATKAAQAVGAYLAIPPALESKSTDFNDLFIHRGPEAVNDAIEAAELPPATVQYFSAVNDDEWSQKNYPLQELPELLREVITEVRSFTQTPVSMVAASAIGVLSLAAQDKFNMERVRGLDGPIGLFFLTIADSGERKTTNDKMFLEPIHAFEAEAEKEASGALRTYKAQHAQWKARQKAIINSNINPKSAKFNPSRNRVGESSMTSDKHIAQMENDKELEDHARTEPEKPKFPHLIYQDATPESLLWELHDTWPAGGIMTSEGNLVFGSHGMSDSSIQKNLGAYNTLWDGDPVRVDRKTSESFTVRDARLTLSIQVQEEPLREFIGRNQGLARHSGFLARCLITHPESTKGSRRYQEPTEHWPARSQYEVLIRGLLNRDRTSEEKPTRRILRFDREAQALWIEFHDAIERELGANGKYAAISDLASKLADNMARIAALFQIAMDGPDGVVTEMVGVEATRGAIAVAEWHLDEAGHFLSSASMPEALRDADRILAWMDKDNLKSITKRDLQRSVIPSEIRHKDRFNAALDELEDQGGIRIKQEDRKQIVIRV